jgi:hypothetical protein
LVAIIRPARFGQLILLAFAAPGVLIAVETWHHHADGGDALHPTNCALCLAARNIGADPPVPDDPVITTCAVECLSVFAFDLDRDVDVRDFTAFQARFTGSL